MTLTLMLELLFRGSDLSSNLAPLLHENSKLWPYHKTLSPLPRPPMALPAYDFAAKATSGIILNSENGGAAHASRSSLRDSRVPSSEGNTVHLEAIGELFTRCLVSPCLQVADGKPIADGDLRFYLAARDIVGLKPGSYYYSRFDSKLILVRDAIAERFEDRVALDPTPLLGCSALIVLTGMVRYDAEQGGERYYRDLLLETGAVANNVLTNAATLGLLARVLSRFLDDPLALEIGIDPRFEQAVAAITLSPWPVGQPR